MFTLGIWGFGRDSAAVLADENSIVAAIEEEKLCRSTGTGAFPRLAIARCLEECHARIGDVQVAAFPRHLATSAARDAKFRLTQTITGGGASGWLTSVGQTFRQAAQIRQIRSQYGASTPLLFLEHHLCHAASAYYTSPFEKALVLTLDERGDMRSGSLYLGEGDELRVLKTLAYPHSLGWFFSSLTQLLGLRPHRDEHKVQWLSKDGKPDFVAGLRNVFRQGADGLPVLNKRYFGREPEEGHGFSSKLLEDLGLDKHTIASDPQVRASLARSAREVLEEIILRMVERYRGQHRVDSLCLAGGLFLNVFLVRAAETRSGMKRVHVQPVAGNSGTALGAALLARKSLGHPARQAMNHLYLGPGFTSGEIKAVLDNCKIIYKYPSSEEALLGEAAQLLERGKIVAWFQGRTEFGHRALGNRSLLASPFSEYVIENVNQYIKHREDFHPFAISAPAEIVPQLFACSPNCRFMASLGEFRPNVPASLERFGFDGGRVRVHAVEQETNPRFWRLLHKFGERNEAPVLLNTSFNLFGEPLVCDPREAIRSFYCAGVDAMVMGDFLLVK
ncbi:MAG TPA: carbamoyltransferase C-terminal domain-containing protein [Candidatus Angelobacter sp.]|nr:carbamoyltransferase C-terminal domain-containing protein [Candidatus Angelobacter sp.]